MGNVIADDFSHNELEHTNVVSTSSELCHYYVLLIVLHFYLNRKYKWLKNYLTWYHMQIAVTGMKMANTSHATCDMTAMVPKS